MAVDNAGYPPIQLPEQPTDIEIFSSLYMKHRFKDEDGKWFPCASMHSDFFYLWTNPEIYGRVIYVAPRGYYKSSFGHIGTLFDILHRGPAYYKEHLVIAASETLANQRIKDLQWDFTENEPLLRAYSGGKPIIGKVWREDEIHIPIGYKDANGKTVCQDVKVVARGRGGSMRGLHPDAVWIDDIEKEGDTGKLSATEVDNIIRWLQGSVFPMVLNKRGRIFFMGNFLAYDSALYKAFYNKDPWGKKGKWFRTIHSARNEDGNSTWPQRFPDWWLAEQEAIMGPLKFAAEMMNQPMASENPLILSEWLRYFDEPQVPPMTYRVLSFDPAQSMRESADYSAWCCIAADVTNQNHQELYYTLGAGHGHWSLNTRIKKIFELNTVYRPDVIRIENNAFQDDMVVKLIEESERLGVSLPIERVRRGKGGIPKDKYTALDSVSHLVELGNVRFRKSQTDLLDELLAFPNGTHDDLVDAFTYSLDAMKNRWQDHLKYYAATYYSARETSEPAISKLGF